MRTDKLISRRAFCLEMAKATFVVASAGVASNGAIAGRSRTAASEIVIDLTDPQNSALGQVGGAQYVPFDGDTVPLIVVRISESLASAFISRCSHMGCSVDLPMDGTATCPCHGSQYDDTGKVTRGPALDDLKSYPANVVGQTIVISLGDLSARRSATPASAPSAVLFDQTPDALVVTADSAGPADLSLYSLSGKKLVGFARIGATRWAGQIRQLPDGWYVVRGTVGPSAFTRRVRIRR